MSELRPRAIFPKLQEAGPRTWGTEEILVHSPGLYTLKRLFLKKGGKGNLQFHRFKDEAAYIISGTLKIVYESEIGVLTEKICGSGEWFRFPAGSIHQEEAVTDVELIEASTPHFNDRVRVEKWFGLKEVDGLPSTSEADIEFG